LAFFVALYASSQRDARKTALLSQAIHDAFHQLDAIPGDKSSRLTEPASRPKFDDTSSSQASDDKANIAPTPQPPYGSGIDATAGTMAAAMPQGMAPHPPPTLDDMKRMGDKKAEPLLAKLKADPNNAETLNQLGILYRATTSSKKRKAITKRHCRSIPRTLTFAPISPRACITPET
jgi:hypothetical protein